jgi:molybdopterin adenylyltransferase
MSATQSKSYKAQVITVSDTRSSGVNTDTVGPLLRSILSDEGYDTTEGVIVPDDRQLISQALIKAADEMKISLIITTGGTGLSPRDVTPEATLDVVTREFPGFCECMRYEGSLKTKRAWLSRGIAGVRNQTLIINVPGSERGAVQSLESVLPVIHHALEIINDDTRECGKKKGEHD